MTNSTLLFACRTDVGRIKDKLSTLSLSSTDVERSDLQYDNAPEWKIVIQNISESEDKELRQWLFSVDSMLLYPYMLKAWEEV